jgi:putative ABC transport system substrate-binding protein
MDIAFSAPSWRLLFITLLGGAAAAWPLAPRAQQAEQMRRIGVLIAGLTENDPEGQLRMTAFRRGLQNLGWIEGRNIHIEERWPGDNAARLTKPGLIHQAPALPL